VDSVPIAERAIAQRAGLGFIGRNHFLIHPKKGLQILLGELIIDIGLAKDSPIESGCNNCDRCIKACPTGALGADGSFDAAKCLSYLTIESKDEIDPQYRKFLGKQLFGCDECIKACPFNNSAPIADKKDFKPQQKLMQLTPEQILKLDEKDFDSFFVNTAIHRTGLEKIKSNAQLILNSYEKTE
jgi:epoxyqueuosine reductase